MLPRTAIIVILLSVPAAALGQLAGQEQGVYRYLSALKPERLFIKAPERPGLPFVIPSTAVGGIAFSPDGRWIATANNFNQIYVWDRKTRQAKWVLGEHFRPTTRLEFSPDSAHLLASDDRDPRNRFIQEEMAVWKVATGELARCYLTMDWSLSKDGKSLAVARRNRDESGGKNGDGKRFKGCTIEIVDFPSHKIRHSISLAEKTTASLALSPDGAILAAGSHKKLLMWNAATGKSAPSIPGLRDNVHLLAFSPDSKILASVSDNSFPASAPHVIELWDAQTAKRIGALEVEDVHNRRHITRLQFVNNQTLLTRRFVGDHEFWSIGQRSVTRRLKAGVVAIFDDGRGLAHNRNEGNMWAPEFFFDAPSPLLAEFE
jgi:WD40 repeat protein